MNTQKEISLISVDYTLEALGIRNLSAALKREGFKTKLILLPKNPQVSYGNSYSAHLLGEVYALVKDSMLIGISCMSFSQNLAIQLINGLKRSSVPLVWGGINATIRPEQCIKFTDMVCVGEGEKTIIALAKKIAAGEPVHNLPGMWIKSGGQLYKNEMPALIEPLDSLALSDYSFENEFVLNQGRSGWNGWARLLCVNILRMFPSSWRAAVRIAVPIVTMMYSAVFTAAREAGSGITVLNFASNFYSI